MRLAVAALFLCDCDGTSSTEPVNGVVPLDPVGRLLRASMAVRGVRPSVEEIELIRQDPDALGGLVDQWMESPEFAATIRDMWAEILLLRNDTFNPLPVLGLFAELPYTDDPNEAAANPDLLFADVDRIYQGTVEEP